MAEKEEGKKEEALTRIQEKKKENEVKQDEYVQDDLVPLSTIKDFEQRIKSRTTPYTYLSDRYSFKYIDSPEKNIFKDVVRALFGCAPFVDKLRQTVSEPVATEFRKLIGLIAYQQRVELDITNLYRRYTEATRLDESKIYFYREYGNIIRYLARIWKTSRFSKLFSITRTVTGYCVLCKKNGLSKNIYVAPYIVKKYQIHDPEFVLEDSLYAERINEMYTCTSCGMVTNYKVVVTTVAPDIIVVVPPENMRWIHRPIDITLPCEETRTHHYTLASFICKIPTKNNITGVGILTEDGNVKFKPTHSKDTGFNFNTDIIHYNLLLYVKKSVVDNYSRVLE
jgi:hypothetical protein